MLFPLGTQNAGNQKKIFETQSKIIQELADKETCIIVGRCSDYVLKEYPNVLNFFIYSDEEHKVNRATTYYGIKSEKAAQELKNKDKKRASYYNYYTSQRWGDAENYHLSLNSDACGIDAAVEILAAFVKAHESIK